MDFIVEVVVAETCDVWYAFICDKKRATPFYEVYYGNDSKSIHSR